MDPLETQAEECIWNSDPLVKEALRTLASGLLDQLGVEVDASVLAEIQALVSLIRTRMPQLSEKDFIAHGLCTEAQWALIKGTGGIVSDQSERPKSEDSVELSDEEAMQLLAAMDAPLEAESKKSGEMSDDEARMLLAAMDEPTSNAGEPSPTNAALKTPAATPDLTQKKDAAAELLAKLGADDEEDEDIPPPKPASPPAKTKVIENDYAEIKGDWEEINEWHANDFQTDPDMVNDFITNTDELMNNLDDLVLKMESTPGDKELIEGIFRAAHTLKGAAGMFGFVAIERIMHRMENLFDLVRKEKLRPSSEIVDLLFKGLDALRPLLGAVKAGKPCGAKTGPVVKALSLAAQGIFETKTPGGAVNDPPSAAIAESPKDVAESPPHSAAQSSASAGGGGDKPAAAEKKDENTTIRVDLSRLDILVNLIGELVIDRTRFVTIEEELRTNHPQIKLSGNIAETVQLFGRHMNEIQDIIMKVRMIPIGNAFNKFTRIIRDLSKQLGKKIDLVITGEGAELDKTLVEQIGDPLIHLIRNSCDHGIEDPETRKKKGKSPGGKINLGARQEGNHIVITIADDGKGIPVDIIRRKGIEKGLITEDQKLSERDILNLIFEPGFSTAEKVTNVSGRGVGMDVVKKQVNKLKGSIEIGSIPDKGTTMTIKLPLTLAIVQSLLVGSKGEIFAVPLSSVIESIRIQAKDIQKVGESEVIKLRDQVLPLMHLDQELLINSRSGNMSEALKNKATSDRPTLNRKTRPNQKSFVVVVGSPDHPFGLVVDQLLNQQEMVIKSMGPLMQNIPCVAGGAVLGNGEVVLVLDIAEIEQSFRQKTRGQKLAA